MGTLEIIGNDIHSQKHHQRGAQTISNGDKMMPDEPSYLMSPIEGPDAVKEDMLAKHVPVKRMPAVVQMHMIAGNLLLVGVPVKNEYPSGYESLRYGIRILIRVFLRVSTFSSARLATGGTYIHERLCTRESVKAQERVRQENLREVAVLFSMWRS